MLPSEKGPQSQFSVIHSSILVNLLLRPKHPKENKSESSVHIRELNAALHGPSLLARQTDAHHTISHCTRVGLADACAHRNDGSVWKAPVNSRPRYHIQDPNHLTSHPFQRIMLPSILPTRTIFWTPQVNTTSLPHTT